MKTIIIDGIEYNLTPKARFKIGDWFVYNDNIYHIGNIALQHYYECLRVDGTVHTFGLDIDSKSHLWTIADAKDGDVIFYDSGWTCIFKCIHGIWYSSYCFITADGEFHTGYEEHLVDAKLNGNVHPATKEQRNTLMKAMADAGYTFDFEKKELKKIEQKHDDLPNGNRKASKDVEGCDNFERKM